VSFHPVAEIDQSPSLVNGQREWPIRRQGNSLDATTGQGTDGQLSGTVAAEQDSARCGVDDLMIRGDGAGDNCLTQSWAGVDDGFAARGLANLGAWIMGRNMFGPIRGTWPDEQWKGWWGNNPPYHVPVFVLTYHARASIPMDGGTTFHFVTGGIHEALERATEAASGRDIRLGGGVATIQQYLRAGLVDEVHLAIAPVLLGSGEHLFAGVDLVKLGYTCTEHVATADATHVVLSK